MNSKIIDEMWEMHNDFVIPEGKIFVALSGGLDSRVLAGIISLRRKIDLGMCMYHNRSTGNLNYVEHLVQNLDYEKFEYIDIGELRKAISLDIAYNELGKGYNLNEYTCLVCRYGETLSGRLHTKARERQFWLRRIRRRKLLENDESIPRVDYSRFKDAIDPLYRKELIGYMFSLTRRQRFFQYAYMQMIKKYLPNLWKIPRCFETTPPCKLDYYLIRRTISRIRDESYKSVIKRSW
jgi:tRNA(Ile)-lysidine synthase TilS/MesJ